MALGNAVGFAVGQTVGFTVAGRKDRGAGKSSFGTRVRLSTATGLVGPPESVGQGEGLDRR
jgi:hypothetical protein